MSKEDLEQIAAIVRAAVEATEERLEKRIQNAIQASEERLEKRIQAAEERMQELARDLQTETLRAVEGLDNRLRTLENRFDNLLVTVTSIDQRMTGLTRWADRLERDFGATNATQKAQQFAIDPLSARVKALEERLGHQQ